MYRALDVMTQEVVTVSVDTTVEQAIKSLLTHRISGAPVVDQAGRVQGIISEYQLLEVLFTPKLKCAPVSSFMTRDVLTVEDSALLTDVASQFVLHRIRRLPVLHDGKLVGVISRRDLLRHVAQCGAADAGLVPQGEAASEV